MVLLWLVTGLFHEAAKWYVSRFHYRRTDSSSSDNSGWHRHSIPNGRALYTVYKNSRVVRCIVYAPTIPDYGSVPRRYNGSYHDILRKIFILHRYFTNLYFRFVSDVYIAECFAVLQCIFIIRMMTKEMCCE